MKKIIVTTNNYILSKVYGCTRLIRDNDCRLFELQDFTLGNIVSVMLVQDSSSVETIERIVENTLGSNEELYLLAHLGTPLKEKLRCEDLINHFVKRFPGCRSRKFHHEQNGFLHLLLQHASSKDWSLLAKAFEELFPPRSKEKEDRLRILSELMCDPTSLQKHLATCHDDEVLEALHVYAQSHDLARLRDTILKPFQS